MTKYASFLSTWALNEKSKTRKLHIHNCLCKSKHTNSRHKLKRSVGYVRFCGNPCGLWVIHWYTSCWNTSHPSLAACPEAPVKHFCDLLACYSKCSISKWFPVSDPVPGACNIESNLDIDPNVYIQYNLYETTIRFAPANLGYER